MKTIESYKHRYAKETLAEWLKDEYIRVDLEKEFVLDGQIVFIADIACYKDGLEAIYEVVHSHGLDANKLNRIQAWQYLNFEFQIYEVQAEQILRQVQKPDKIRKYDFSNQK